MNKKLMTAIVGVGMGLASTGAFANLYERCTYVLDHCINSGESQLICQARYEACIGGINF